MSLDRSLRSCLLGGLLVTAFSGAPPGRLTVPAAEARDLISCEQAFMRVVEEVRPSVVTVIAYSDLPGGVEAREHNGLELKKSVGSGVVINSEGHIVTAMSVVGESRNLFIRTHDGKEQPAIFLGADHQTDLVLLKTKPEGLKPARFGQPSELQPGAWAIIIGESFGQFPRYAFGAFTTVASTADDTGMPAMLQMSAQVYPGYTGGAVANADGEVVGVVLAAMSGVLGGESSAANRALPKNGGGTTVGPSLSLAIPIDHAMRVGEELAKHGTMASGYLGVRVRTPAPALKDLLKFEDGVLILDVVAGSPAEAAGIEAGDVILTFCGTKVREEVGFVRLVASIRPDTRCEVQMLRGDEPLNRQVILSTWPASQVERRAAEQRRRQLERRVDDMRQKLRLLEEQLRAEGGS
jgi:serine protease Do